MDGPIGSLSIEKVSDRKLTGRMQGNLSQLYTISRKFSDEAGIPEHEPPIINQDTIVIESGHQPNFFPYSGIWKKAYFLDYIRETLTRQGKNVVAVFGFADVNLSTAKYLYQNHIPAYNTNGSKKIGFDIEDNSSKWRSFHSIPKPKKEDLEKEISKITAHYIENARRVNVPTPFIENKIKDFSDILWSCYHHAGNFSDMNAFIFSNICEELFDSKLFFYRYSDIYKKNIFLGETKIIVQNIDTYREIYNKTIDQKNLGIPKIPNNYFPFWYQCDCGGLIRLETDPDNNCRGNCIICEKEIIFPLKADYSGIDEQYSRLDFTAVVRNLVIGEGLGVSIFIPGSGGALTYGEISREIADHIGFNRYTSFTWKSKDFPMGIIQYLAFNELRKHFKISDIYSIESTVSKILREQRENYDKSRDSERTLQGEAQPGALNTKESKKLLNLLNHSISLTRNVKRVFSQTPSMLDLLLNINGKDISNSWKLSLDTVSENKIGDNYQFSGDNSYLSEYFPVSEHQIPTIYHQIELIDV